MARKRVHTYPSYCAPDMCVSCRRLWCPEDVESARALRLARSRAASEAQGDKSPAQPATHTGQTNYPGCRPLFPGLDPRRHFAPEGLMPPVPPTGRTTVIRPSEADTHEAR